MIFTTLSLLSVGTLAWTIHKAQSRWLLSRAKHPSLTGHSRMAKRLAGWIPGYAYDESGFLGSDGAPADLIEMRRAGLNRLATEFESRFARSQEMSQQARQGLSDLQFTGVYRVPFQYSPYLRSRLSISSFLQRSTGVMVEDLDGNHFFDLTGSYGVNLLGYDTYKACIEEATHIAASLGPVLGAYHPCVLDNVRRLQVLSGMDEVTFHMSGTEAVMQAVRLARYQTGRKYVVRFCGAYHGWWEDVQPGPGNPMPPRETYTLRDMDERSLQVLRDRKDIACVLINPLQALHPNANAPGDNALVDSSRKAAFDRVAYTEWLQKLREVCTSRGIALIFDEVFLGFRLAPGGAQSYFGITADLVTYGKTLGGGLPVGVVCGKRSWMRRYREDRPADICFARGTFNAHPYVMAAMNSFLRRLDTQEVVRWYQGLDERWDGHVRQFNERFQREGLPIRVSNLSSVWTVTYVQPSRYNWMYQFYLRIHGIALSWVGTGRLIFSLNFSDQDMQQVLERFVQAGHRMRQDGWWLDAPLQTNRTIRRGLFKEMMLRRWSSKPQQAQ